MPKLTLYIPENKTKMLKDAFHKAKKEEISLSKRFLMFLNSYLLNK